jgi:hypothetical protein
MVQSSQSSGDAKFYIHGVKIELLDILDTDKSVSVYMCFLILVSGSQGKVHCAFLFSFFLQYWGLNSQLLCRHSST